MKKLILLCGFGLLGTFAMAGNEMEKEQSSYPVVEITESTNFAYVLVDGEWVCVPVTLSCGITGVACGSTTAEILANVKAAEKELCGFSI